MRAHKRGGSLLVVPAQSDEWRASIRHPITYSVIPPYTELAELLRKKDEENRLSRRTRWRTQWKPLPALLQSMALQ